MWPRLISRGRVEHMGLMELYRRALQLDTGDQMIATAATAANPIFTGEEEKSSGNVSRGDRI